MENADLTKIKEKAYEATVEPQHQVIRGTTKQIHLALSAISNYSSYSCPINNIIVFDDTYVYQVFMKVTFLSYW